MIILLLRQDNEGGAGVNAIDLDRAPAFIKAIIDNAMDEECYSLVLSDYFTAKQAEALRKEWNLGPDDELDLSEHYHEALVECSVEVPYTVERVVAIYEEEL